MPKALITGITGQDGSYLAELLLQKSYEVFGMIRRASTFNTARLDHLYEDPHEPTARLRLVYGDLGDSSSLNQIIKTIRPDEVYNLGAQSHVRTSFDIPEYTTDITGTGTVRLLEAIREAEVKTRFTRQRAVWQGPRNAATGNHSFQSPQSVCLRQGLGLLRDGELP